MHAQYSMLSDDENYSDVIYHYFNIFPPGGRKNREARSTALQMIRLITRRVVAGRHCILFRVFTVYSVFFFFWFFPSKVTTADSSLCPQYHILGSI